MPEREGILIRRAGPADVDVLHEGVLKLARHLGQEEHVRSSAADLRRYAFSGSPVVFGEIAEVDSAFAGMCLHFPIYSTWLGRPGVYVQDLFVEPAFRGRKIGERLLRHVAWQAREAGGGFLRLSVDTDNEGAQAFYETIGIGRAEYEQIHRVMGAAFDAFCDG